jgi:hypothetical protein
MNEIIGLKPKDLKLKLQQLAKKYNVDLKKINVAFDILDNTDDFEP